MGLVGSRRTEVVAGTARLAWFTHDRGGAELAAWSGRIGTLRNGADHLFVTDLTDTVAKQKDPSFIEEEIGPDN